MKIITKTSLPLIISVQYRLFDMNVVRLRWLFQLKLSLFSRWFPFQRCSSASHPIMQPRYLVVVVAAVRSDIREYYLNGDNEIQPEPEPVEMGGTTFEYHRLHVGIEYLSALGPLTEPLVFEVRTPRARDIVTWQWRWQWKCCWLWFVVNRFKPKRTTGWVDFVGFHAWKRTQSWYLIHQFYRNYIELFVIASYWTAASSYRLNIPNQLVQVLENAVVLSFRLLWRST